MSGALPTFVIIGAGKCGTTSLHHYLGEHPEIQASRRKELRFFIDEPVPEADQAGPRQVARGDWHRGVEWYRSWFSPEYEVRGEASPAYMSPRFEGAAERMREVVPDAKLIVCVRDPVRRALSNYRQACDDRYERRSLEDALQPGRHYLNSSRYAECLAPFLERWTMEDIHVIAQEDLLVHRRETLSRVFAFLGVASDYWSPTYETRLNVSARKSGLSWRALQALRRQRWWHRVADRAPRSALPALDRLTTAQPARAVAAPAPSAALLEQMADAVRGDAERLRALTGRRFPEWSV